MSLRSSTLNIQANQTRKFSPRMLCQLRCCVDSALSALTFGAVVIGVYSEAAKHGRKRRKRYRHWEPLRETFTIFDLYEQVRDVVSPLELELRYAELDELGSQLVDIMWTFVGALARAHGYTDADWDTAERSLRHALDEQS